MCFVDSLKSNMEEMKTFYVPGDIVTLRHDLIENKPVMYVVEKVTKSFVNKDSDERENVFVGIKTRWFDKNQVMHEAIFSTKDLIHV